MDEPPAVAPDTQGAPSIHSISFLEDFLLTVNSMIPFTEINGEERAVLFTVCKRLEKAIKGDRSFYLIDGERELLSRLEDVITLSEATFKDYLTSTSPHPLDGMYDPSLSLPDGTVPRSVLDNVSVDSVAKQQFLVCLQVVELLEARSSFLGVSISKHQLAAIDSMTMHFTSSKLGRDTVTRFRSSLLDERGSVEQLWLSRLDTHKALHICRRLSRPKPKVENTIKPDTAQYALRSLSEILLDFTFDRKLALAAREVQAVVFNYIEACDLYAVAMLSFQEGHGATLIDASLRSYRNHPQVTGLAKLREFLARPSENLTLSREEAMFLHILATYVFECWSPDAESKTTDHDLKDALRLYHQVRPYSENEKATAAALQRMTNLFPRLAKKWNSSSLMLFYNRVKDVREEIEVLLKKQDEDANQIADMRKSLKSVSAKERKIKETEALLTAARDDKTAREEKLRSENFDLKYELAALKVKLEAANEEPDKVRNQFAKKMQRLHDKVAEKDKIIAEKDEVIAEKEKLCDRYKAAGARLKKEYNDLKAQK